MQKRSMTAANSGSRASAPHPSQLRDLLTSFACANLADGLLFVAIPLLAVSTTRSAFEVSVVSVARFAPWAVLAPVVGVFVDRVALRGVLIAASILRSVILAGIVVLVISDRMNIGLLATASLLVGVAEVIYDISAMTALPAVTTDANLEGANSKQATIREVLDGLLGPALGGFLVASGIRWAFLAGAICYALAAILALRLPSLAAVQSEHDGVLREMADGMRTLWADPLLRTFLLMTACGAVAFAGWQPVFSLFANAPGPIGLDPFRFGLVYSIGAVGAATCSLSLRWLLPRVRRSYLVICARGLAPISLLLPVLRPSFLAAAVAMVGYSTSVIILNVITLSYRQRRVPASMLGRINSAYRALAWGVVPLGPVLAGTIGSLTHSNGAGMVAMAALSACAALMLPIIWRHRSNLDEPAGREHDKRQPTVQ